MKYHVIKMININWKLHIKRSIRGKLQSLCQHIRCAPRLRIRHARLYKCLRHNQKHLTGISTNHKRHAVALAHVEWSAGACGNTLLILQTLTYQWDVFGDTRRPGSQLKILSLGFPCIKKGIKGNDWRLSNGYRTVISLLINISSTVFLSSPNKPAFLVYNNNKSFPFCFARALSTSKMPCSKTSCEREWNKYLL